MRYWIMGLAALCLTAFADKVTIRTVGCASLDALSGVPDASGGTEEAFSRYLREHDCVVFSESDGIQVVDRTSPELEGLFYIVVSERTGRRYYVRRSAVMLEQPGTKNRFRF